MIYPNTPIISSKINQVQGTGRLMKACEHLHHTIDDRNNLSEYSHGYALRIKSSLHVQKAD